ncbi:MAG: hypothetical protein IJ671_01175 [Succinivibrio sp.]|nr:hypothetical protein [Succinivibrio sp.]
MIPFIIGISGGPCVSMLFGCKLVLNEFIAFSDLVKTLSQMDYRTQAMLCIGVGGFANIGSTAVVTSTIGTLCKDKQPVMASLAPRALLGAFFA